MTNSDKTSLGDRMKGYEGAFKASFPPRLPVILRVDGKAFHTLLKGARKPFDDSVIEVMNETAAQLCHHIQGAQMAYVQSDEISVLIHGYKKFTSSAWFDNQIQKMVSVGASVATATFNNACFDPTGVPLSFKPPAFFDARAFVLPESEVCNYFLWRQQDCSRNSIQMLARSLYSHKECNDKNGSELQEMCFQKGQNWNAIPTAYRRGRVIFKEYYQAAIASGAVRSRWAVDSEIPIFSEDREYINKHLKTDEE